MGQKGGAKKPSGVAEFSGIFARTVKTLMGLAGLYLLFGFLVVKTYLKEIHLDGLIVIDKNAYEHAVGKFFMDAVETYTANSDVTLWLAGIILVVVYIRLIFKYRVRSYSRRFWDGLACRINRHSRFLIMQNGLGVKWNLAVFGMLSVIIATLYLDDAAALLANHDPERVEQVILFMISLPALVGVLAYMAFKFREFQKGRNENYYIPVIVFIFLFLLIPYSYGRFIYDMSCYEVCDLKIGNSVPAMDAEPKSPGVCDKRYLLSNSSGDKIFCSLPMSDGSGAEVMKVGTLADHINVEVVREGLVDYIMVGKRMTLRGFSKYARDDLMKNAYNQNEIEHVDKSLNELTTTELPAGFANSFKTEDGPT